MAAHEPVAGLRRAEIMTSEKSNSVKLNFSKDNLSITANTPDVGEAREGSTHRTIREPANRGAGAVAMAAHVVVLHPAEPSGSVRDQR